MLGDAVHVLQMHICYILLCLFHFPPSLSVSAQRGPYKKLQRTSYHIGSSSWVPCSKYTRCTGPGPGFSSPSRAHAPFVVRPTVPASLASQLLLHIISQCLCTPIIYVCASHSASVQILESTFQNKSLFLQRRVHPGFSIRKWWIPTVRQRHVSSGGFKLTFLMLSPHWNC